jgi:hypothetical protein
MDKSTMTRSAFNHKNSRKMENQERLNSKILSATKKIQDEYPELVKYMNEIPINFTENASNEVKETELKNYLESLKDIAINYAKEHPNPQDLKKRP